jgi:D-alanine--poly(phosphoribitol) ligase subunit 1
MTGTFVDDIHAHAERRPTASAILTPDGCLSYRQLAERIDRLAWVLRSHDLGPDQVCTVALDRSLDALIAIAAVTRAGGAFSAVDVELPLPRLAAMVRDSRAEMLLTTAALAARLPLPVDGPTVRFDETAPAMLGDPEFPQCHPRALAYVSFTSGSTGTPNPVLIEQRGLDAYLRGLVRDCRLGSTTVALQVAPLGYDASIRDMFAPLVGGGQLVLVPRAQLLRADAFAETLRIFGVTTLLSVTPSLLTFLAQHGESAVRLQALAVVAASGESLQPFLASGGRELLAGRLVNQYGPTECTMTSTRYRVPAEPDTDDVIGNPIEAVTIQLLDADLQPVADGGAGEIHIGGIGVARAYLGRAALTADRFRPDPSGQPGSRIYRTGDLGRRRADGSLVYLGRTDRQVKIRGYRVDPAEIEGCLLSHPAVTGAAIASEQDARGRTALTAYLTGPLADVTDAALRQHLAGSLPFYMLPRGFVRLDRFPLTHSGKIDRGQLAAHRPTTANGLPKSTPAPQPVPTPARTPSHDHD